MSRNKKKIAPLPDAFQSLQEASDFWDTHSAADYWDESKEATFEIELDEEPRYFVLEREIAKKLHQIARAEKVPAETLGRVDELLNDEKRRRDIDECEKSLCQFLVTGRNPSKLFDFVKKSLDLFPQ